MLRKNSPDRSGSQSREGPKLGPDRSTQPGGLAWRLHDGSGSPKEIWRLPDAPGACSGAPAPRPAPGRLLRPSLQPDPALESLALAGTWSSVAPASPGHKARRKPQSPTLGPATQPARIQALCSPSSPELQPAPLHKHPLNFILGTSVPNGFKSWRNLRITRECSYRA